MRNRFALDHQAWTGAGAGLATALLLLACGPSVGVPGATNTTTNTTTSTGAGGSFETTGWGGAGASTATGSSTTGTTGQGNTGGGNTGAPCSDCTVDEICHLGQCQLPESTLLLDLIGLPPLDVSYPLGPSPGPRTYFSACSYEGPAGPITPFTMPASPPLDSLDPCDIALEPYVPEAAWAGTVGVVSLSSALLGTAKLGDKLSQQIPCDAKTLFDTQLVPGDLVTFSVEGGPAFPAFSHAATAPEALEITAGAYVPGNPLALAWTGSGPGRFVVRIFPQGKPPPEEGVPAVHCILPDNGGYSVPAFLLHQIEPYAKWFQIEVARIVTADVVVPGVPSIAHVSIGHQRGTSVEVDP